MPGAAAQTLRPFLWRASELYPDREIVSRTQEGIRRSDYAAFADRTARLADALADAGVGERDRVATFCWNHDRHFETYFGVPNMGAQLHTINPLLPDHRVRYIVENAGDRVVFVDRRCSNRSNPPPTRTPSRRSIIDEMPKTATGKFDKKSLRDRYDDQSLVGGKVPEESAPEGS